MRALTIKQPWVHAILHEGKDIENRSWQRDFRGSLALHASCARFPLGQVDGLSPPRPAARQSMRGSRDGAIAGATRNFPASVLHW